ncbi:YdcF family protein [Prescottella defluvii]|uniref:YdcF family protein n=1 Tax=Prescottella defluvii TaxID=1323361 RepID=UPI0004F32499|nr:YdcF family protein [Prescottella defluvii]
MSPRSLRLRSRLQLRSRLVVPAVIAAAAAAIALPGQAAAESSLDIVDALSVTTLVNGALSVAGGCQSQDRDSIVACTRMETLTTQVPVMLAFNPFATNIVVLGAGLYDDGTMRPLLVSRLQAALQLAQRFPLAPIIVTGGVPKSGVTEAQAMRQWLVANGILPFRITEENTSRSTVENAVNTNRILADRGANGAVVVTSPDHLQRAMVDFRVAVAGRIPIAGVVAPF